MNWIILVPRGAEYQSVQRGLRRRSIVKPTVQSIAGDTTLSAIAIPAGQAVKPWLAEHLTEHLAEHLTDESPLPTQFLVLGLCGGLNDRTRMGTVVLYDRPTLAQSPLAQRLNVQSVRGITIDRVLCVAAEKRQLARESEADVVDMESQWIVDYVQSFERRVTVIRVVSDDVTGDLPDLSAAFDTNGDLRPGALALAFIRNPIAALRLIRGALIALRQLEEWVAELDLEHLKV